MKSICTRSAAVRQYTQTFFEEARFKNVPDIQCLGTVKTQSFVQDS